MTLRLTNSEMSTWRRCKRQWWLGHHRGLQPRDEPVAGGPLTIGTRVHRALAAHYAGNDALAVLNTSTKTDIVVHPLDEDRIRAEHDLCEAMVSGYLEWLEETGADSNIKVIAPETMVEVPLASARLSGEVTLLSKLDARVDRLTGMDITPDVARLALEFKTVGSLTAALPTLQIDSQLLTEHLVEFLALKKLGDDRAENRAQGVLYRMLRKVKRTARANPPFYAEEEVRHNLDELRSHWRHVVAIAGEILEAKAALAAGENHHAVVYPSPRATCSWDCRFLEACKMLDDGSDAEGYLAARYVTADPLARYDGLEMEEV